MATQGEKARGGRKRQATRQRISDVATRLFLARGFEAVTVEEIAAAAEVSRMTVFNHFARKEDMFFDLDEEGRNDLIRAMEERPEGVSAVEALRRFPRQAMAEDRSYTRLFDRHSVVFLETVERSPALQARAYAIRDELADVVAAGLARSIGRRAPDAAAVLGAALVLATWTAALREAHASFAKHGDRKKAQRLLMVLVDRGMRGVAAALEGTPYV